MDRRGFLGGLAALSFLPTKKLFDAVAKTATIPAPVVKTYKLKATWSPELAQDLQAVHGISAEQELKLMLRDEIEREIGQERGEITSRKVLDQDTFIQRYQMIFRNNGKYSADGLWGLNLYPS
jgi:hypothetical protein